MLLALLVVNLGVISFVCSYGFTCINVRVHCESIVFQHSTLDHVVTIGDEDKLLTLHNGSTPRLSGRVRRKQGVLDLILRTPRTLLRSERSVRRSQAACDIPHSMRPYNVPVGPKLGGSRKANGQVAGRTSQASGRPPLASTVRDRPPVQIQFAYTG